MSCAYFNYTIKFEDKYSFDEALDFFKNLDVKKHFRGMDGKRSVAEIINDFIPNKEIYEMLKIDETSLQVLYTGDEFSNGDSQTYFNWLLELLVKMKKN